MKPAYFFLIAFFAISTAVSQVILHQRHANSLADAIVSKDKAGLNYVAGEQELKTYTNKHTGIKSEVFLAGSYERASSAAEAAANPQSNGQIYAAAQAACASRADSVTQTRCVAAYISQHAQPSSNPQAVAKPTKAAYTKSYSSPGWKADSAGIALLVAAMAIAAGVYAKMSKR